MNCNEVFSSTNTLLLSIKTAELMDAALYHTLFACTSSCLLHNQRLWFSLDYVGTRLLVSPSGAYIQPLLEGVWLPTLGDDNPALNWPVSMPTMVQVDCLLESTPAAPNGHASFLYLQLRVREVGATWWTRLLKKIQTPKFVCKFPNMSWVGVSGLRMKINKNIYNAPIWQAVPVKQLS